MTKANIDHKQIVAVVLRHFPDVQGVYLFGSHATGQAWPNSDVDIALLLPHDRAKEMGNLHMSPCRVALTEMLRRPVDLINARMVSTVLQKELIYGQRLYYSDVNAMDEFEMLTLSFYQKLNEERADILEAFAKTGRAYPV